ncbi:MAG: hypothetical protein KDK41_02935 [Leptospiraceae bacterium]|nr:hypothetical protein [Leptospiraceae bacterium]
MPGIRAYIIFSSLFINIILQAKTSYIAGTTLQGFGTQTLLAGIETEIRYERNRETSAFSAELRLPLLMNERGVPIYPLYTPDDLSPGYTDYRLPDSLWLLLKELKYRHGTPAKGMLVGITPLQTQTLGHGHMSYLFAGYSTLAPYYSSGFVASIPVTDKSRLHIESGALAERGPWRMFTEIQPAENSKYYFMQGLKILPLLYVDSPQPDNFIGGGGLEIHTGGYAQGQFKLGSAHSIVMEFHNTTTRGRITSGLWFTFWNWGAEAGMISSSQGDYTGPIQSPLYMYTRNLTMKNHSRNGFYLGVLPGSEKQDGWTLRWEAFPTGEATSNLRVAWQSPGDLAIRLGYIKENMDHIKEIIDMRSRFSWAEIGLHWQYIPRLLSIRWDNHFSPASRDYYRGRLSIHWLF